MKSRQLLCLDEILNFTKFSNNWPVFFVLLVQNLRVLKVVDQTVESLQTSVGQIAYLNEKSGYLLASELRPFSSLKHSIELEQILSVEEINETIANIALIFDITR